MASSMAAVMPTGDRLCIQMASLMVEIRAISSPGR
jgi:hypothetical protein